MKEEAIIHVRSFLKSSTPGVGMECELESNNERNYCYSDIEIVKKLWERIDQNRTSKPSKYDECLKIRRYQRTGDLLGPEGPIYAPAEIEDDLKMNCR